MVPVQSIMWGFVLIVFDTAGVSPASNNDVY
jgi:hypothetical protein